MGREFETQVGREFETQVGREFETQMGREFETKWEENLKLKWEENLKLKWEDNLTFKTIFGFHARLFLSVHPLARRSLIANHSERESDAILRDRVPTGARRA